MSDLHTALRAWARGIYVSEAGVELMIRSEWAERIAGAGFANWSEDRRYCHPEVGLFLQQGGYLSGGEYRQVTMIASLLGQLVKASNDPEGVTSPYDAQLYECIPGVDEEFIRLFMSAVGHASGLPDRGGNPLPWPGESPFYRTPGAEGDL